MDDMRLLATVLRAQQEVGLQVLFLPSPKQIRLTGYESFMFKKLYLNICTLHSCSLSPQLV